MPGKTGGCNLSCVKEGIALAISSRNSPLYTSFCLNNCILVWVEVREIDAQRGTIDGCQRCIFIVVVLKAYLFRGFFTNRNVRSRGRIPKMYLKVDIFWVF